MKRLVRHLMIIWIACCPFVQACSSNGNPPPVSAPETEAPLPHTRTTEIVEEKTHPIIKKVVTPTLRHSITKATQATIVMEKKEIQETAPRTTEATKEEKTEKATEVAPVVEVVEVVEATEAAEEPVPVVEAEATVIKRTAKKADILQRYIAVKTNLAYHASLVNNLAIEVQCSKHVSVELPIIWSQSEFNNKHAIRTFALQPEARWWMSEAGRGHFFGLHAHTAWFNVKWENDHYQDNGRPLLGAGLSYGYTLPFAQHWGAEFTLGAGYANMKYDTYYNIDNGSIFSSGETKNYWGITRVGLSLVYRF